MKKVTIAAFIAAATLLSGCATDQMKKDIAEAQATATEARAAAVQAQSSADAAESRAQAAEATAQSAMDAANDAQACCNANGQKIDRMFRKAMMK